MQTFANLVGWYIGSCFDWSVGISLIVAIRLGRRVIWYNLIDSLVGWVVRVSRLVGLLVRS